MYATTDTSMLFDSILGWCNETGGERNEESLQASQNWSNWGELL